MCKLQTTTGWEMRVFRAIVRWPSRMDLWNEWQQVLQNYGAGDREATARAFYDANRAAMDA